MLSSSDSKKSDIMAVVIGSADIKTVAPVPEAGTQTQKKRDSTKWLHKTKICVYSLQGTCRLGDKCSYAHSASEVQDTPNLAKTQLCEAFAEGKCDDPNCTFAHGLEELRLSPNYKNKLCKWYGKGKCRNGDECGFAHGVDQLRATPQLTCSEERLFPVPGGGAIKPPPGLSLPENTKAMPVKQPAPLVLDLESNLLDEKAPVPLEHQVGEMSAAIMAMQSKMDDMLLRAQVSDMRQVLESLNAQCCELDSALKQTSLENSLPVQKTPLKAPVKTPLRTRLSSKAVPFTPFTPMGIGIEARSSASGSTPSAPGCEWPSDDSTSIGSEGFASD